MNKLEYLKELEGHIHSLPVMEKQEILVDYEEHFRIGELKGKSEREIIEALGSAKSVAQAILINTYVSEAESARSLTDRLGAVFQILLAVLILAPFNFLMLVCPFLILICLLIAGWSLPLTILLTGLAILILSVPTLGFVGVLSGLYLFSAGIGIVSFSVASGILMIWFSQSVFRLIVSYCKWNVNFIRASTDGAKGA